MNLPPLPSLEDLFGSPSPFTGISPLKSESLLMVAETAPATTSNHFEPISDEEAEGPPQPEEEPAAKRWKANDYYMNHEPRGEAPAGTSDVKNEQHATREYGSNGESTGSLSGDRVRYKIKRSHHHSREDRKSGEQGGGGHHRRRSSRAENGDHGGASDGLSDFFADNAFAASDHVGFSTDIGSSAGIFNTYGGGADELNPFSADYGYDSYTNVVDQGFSAPDDDLLPLIGGGVPRFIDPDEYLTSSAAPIGSENDRVNSSGEFSGISEDFLAAAAMEIADEIAKVDIPVTAGVAATADVITTACDNNATAGPVKARLCPVAMTVADAIENNVGDANNVDGIDEDDDDEDDDVEEPQGIARLSSPSEDSQPFMHGQQYDILDDLTSGDEMEEDVYQGLSSEDSEVEEIVNEAEIEAMLEEGVSHYPPANVVGGPAARRRIKNSVLADGGDEDFNAPVLREKIVLIEKSQNPFEILPVGWLMVSHSSGMPVYLHKPSRVCTLSRPYHLGPGSARRHEVPVSSIPCLQYRRAVDKAKATENLDGEASKSPPDKEVSLDKEVTLPTSTDAMQAVDSVSQQDVTSTTSGILSSGAGVEGDNTEGGSMITEEGQAAAAAPSVSNRRPVAGAGVKVQSVEEHKKANTLSPLDFREYCQNLFEFRAITVRKFRRWKDRRRHNLQLKEKSRPTLPPSTKLITCPVPNQNEAPHARRKAFVLNPAGKSDVCILHEYAQHAIRIQPRYIFRELENALTPYSATVVINDVQYGTGYAISKKLAKVAAAHVALGVLIPDMGKVSAEDAKKYNVTDLSFFDEILIEDLRVSELCSKAGQPSPYQILVECLKRNYGMGDTQIKTSMATVKHQMSKFTMKVGKHEASVICKNKRDGKQQASQAILQLMHPFITTWGSLLRLYAKSTDIKEKKDEEHSITTLQTKAQPNRAILSKLKQEMTKLYIKTDAIKSTMKGKVNLETPAIVSSELGSVEF